jgi:hypothetical protein
MKKRYKLEYSGAFPMIVEVDDEKFTPEILNDWNTFWSDAESRAAHKSGSALVPLLEMAYLNALSDSVTYNSAKFRLENGENEGYPPFDGSVGLTIVSIEDYEFDAFEVTCDEVPA